VLNVAGGSAGELMLSQKSLHCYSDSSNKSNDMIVPSGVQELGQQVERSPGHS